MKRPEPLFSALFTGQPAGMIFEDEENPGSAPGLSSARFAVDQVGPRGMRSRPVVSDWN